jgi:hypothetical protein
MTPIVLECGDQPPFLSLHQQVSFYVAFQNLRLQNKSSSRLP